MEYTGPTLSNPRYTLRPFKTHKTDVLFFVSLGGNATATKNLIPSLLRLYVDIEFTGGANQFYDKFNIRHQIGEMCEYLWRIESHQNAWQTLATRDETVRFAFPKSGRHTVYRPVRDVHGRR